MRRWLIVPLVLTGLLTTACGIGQGPVQGHGRPPGTAPGDARTKENLAWTTAISDERQLVRAFLEASADDPSTREQTLRSYLVKDEAWKPGTVLNLIHVIDLAVPRTGVNSITVQARVLHIGVLNAQGRIEPSTKGEETIDFVMVHVAGEGFKLRTPRVELLLAESGLKKHFQARPVYFWDNLNAGLVPDLRYVPVYLSEGDKSRRLVEWLYQGPVPWLDATLRRPDPATYPEHSLTVAGTEVSINLPVQPNPEELARLAEQLAKTLLGNHLNRLVLKIQNQVLLEKTVSSTEAVVPQRRYGVVDGVVRRLKGPAGDPVGELAILGDANKNVALAAISGGESAVMVVHNVSGGQQLSVRVAATEWRVVPLPGLSRPKNFAQPVWLRGGEHGFGLVLADGRLFQISTAGTATEIGPVADLRSFAVSPDGRRIALVVGTKLYTAALVSNEKGALTVGQTLSYVPVILPEVQSVAFGRPFELVVAGKDAAGVRVVTLNIDGAQQYVSPSNPLAGNVTIYHLVADGQLGNALYEAEGLGGFQYEYGGSTSLKDKVIPTGPPPSSSPQSDVHAPSFESVQIK